MVSKGKQFLQHVVPAVIRPIRVLWNEVIGFVFLAIAVLFSRSAWDSVHALDGEPASFLRMVLSVFFVGILAFFGVQSFWKARKIRRGA